MCVYNMMVHTIINQLKPVLSLFIFFDYKMFEKIRYDLLK